MVTMPLGGITGGTEPILGYNFGARRSDRVIRAQKYIACLALVFTSVMFIASQTLPHYFVRIFTHNEEYISLTVWAIRIYTVGIIPLALQYASCLVWRDLNFLYRGYLGFWRYGDEYCGLYCINSEDIE